MSGYPGSGYPGQQGRYPAGGSFKGNGYPGNRGGYPGGGSAPPPGGYPGAPQTGGYPGAPPASGYPGAPSAGGYPGSQQAGGYPGGAPAGGYPGAPPAGAPQAPPGGYSGGYGQPQVDPSVAQWFQAVDSDRSGHITADELKRALVNGNWSHFSEEACRMMIEMFDRKRSGTINISEFSELFKYINQWKATFEGIDRDRSGYIELNELTQAFQQMGYRFSPTFVQNLLAKFDSRTRRLSLDNFIVACVQIKRLTDGFRARDRAMQGQATLQYEDFVGLAMGVHQ